MLGAIAGDVVGSVHERTGTKTTEFPLFVDGSRFTDDTLMTVAVAEAILTGRSYGEVAHALGRRHPGAGWGKAFAAWLASDAPRPYGSWGNGAAMRVTPIGLAFDHVDDVLREAEASAVFSHDHPDAVRGAQAAALAVFLARTGATKEELRSELGDRFGYDLARTVEGIRPGYRFDVSCAGSVPEAIVAFLDATSWEDAVRGAISLGGDADTLACIAGGIAEAHFGPLPHAVAREVRARLDPELLDVVDRFAARHPARLAR